MTTAAPGNHGPDTSVNQSAPAPATTDGRDVVAGRPADDDHDLLTFGEAGARLAEEIERQERHLAALREARADEGQIGAADRRLEALRRASARNRKPSLEELRRSGFFGRQG